MPEYRQVARLTVNALLEDRDQPKIVPPDATLRVSASEIAETPLHTVIVGDDERGVIGVISASDIASAVSEGMDLESKVTDLLVRKPPPAIVRDTTTLEELADLVGPFPTIVIADERNQPKAIIDREELATRIRRFVSPS